MRYQHESVVEVRSRAVKYVRLLIATVRKPQEYTRGECCREIVTKGIRRSGIGLQHYGRQDASGQDLQDVN